MNVIDAANVEMRHECGVFGIVLADPPHSDEIELSSTLYTGLLALQHRGQESAGIAASDGGTDIKLHKGMGLVTSVFSKETLQNVKGTLGIGHTRYSTLGSSDIGHAQPLVVDTVHGRIAVAHNGELVNAKSLRTSVMQSGVGLSTKTDSELIAQLLTITPSHGERDGRPDWPARIRNFMDRSETAYSIVVIAGTSLFAVRDPVGNRPLCLGKLIKSDSSSTSPSPKRMCLNGGAGDSVSSSAPGWVVSSESCSFWSAGAKLVRELLPGEIVEIRATGFESHGIVKPKANTISPALCVFEYVYFARPDSVLEGQMVYSVRKRCGKQLALESPVDADVIGTVPESATPAAIGYAEQSGIRYAEVLMKSRYAGRTFIRPDERSRRLGVMHKFGPLTENFKGKRVVLVDDSIVRGTTIGPIIRMLKVNGAKEVHIRIASPPLKYACYMGINIPTREELIANRLDANELADYVNADSLAYLSHDGLILAVQSGIDRDKEGGIGHCSACLTGKYPVELEW